MGRILARLLDFEVDLGRVESALNAREAISEGERGEWSLCMVRRR
jgi:hypothetical protein